ncbi:outer membrane beta-barrel protein [Helicobacter pylori]|uniref:outer membrane beta-barrel protein n=1 Tax=Helicobacter pylori TaxID=210 RepID=UPI00059C4321|nr:outer membrane beta-barrel protein [Helicobacter pylori]WQS05559.1 outer membrane protein [Helicobacter pylori]WQS14965.1 outer membrane protein [Helicobacter pylori]WQS24700.1 outer membrane protein [Helicobacter pylori]
MLKNFKKSVYFYYFLIVGLTASVLDATPIIRNNAPQKNYQEAHEKLYRSIINRQKLTRQKSGWYFLGGFGAVEATKDYQGKEVKNWIVTFNLKTGVQSFFKKYIGIRGVFAWDLGAGRVNYQRHKDPTNSFFNMFAVGLDIILEFPLGSYKHYLGAFGGAGGALAIYADRQDFKFFRHAVYSGGLVIDGGVTLTLFLKHRFEVGFKILPTARLLSDSKRFETSPLFYTAYSYKF